MPATPEPSHGPPKTLPVTRVVRRPRGSNTVNIVLGLTAFTLAVILLVGVIYILTSGLLAPDAPRTALERELKTFESAVHLDPEDPRAHADYAQALIVAGDFSTADEVIVTGLELTDDDPLLLVARARLEYARGDADTALSTIDEVEADLAALRAEKSAELASRGITGTALGLPRSDVAIESAVLEAQIREDQQDWAGVIAASTRALDEDPTMADILAKRARAHAALGDSEAARTDYAEALRFVPGLESAVTGLEDLGGEQ